MTDKLKQIESQLNKCPDFEIGLGDVWDEHREDCWQPVFFTPPNPNNAIDRLYGTEEEMDKLAGFLNKAKENFRFLIGEVNELKAKLAVYEDGQPSKGCLNALADDIDSDAEGLVDGISTEHPDTEWIINDLISDSKSVTAWLRRIAEKAGET